MTWNQSSVKLLPDTQSDVVLLVDFESLSVEKQQKQPEKMYEAVTFVLRGCIDRHSDVLVSEYVYFVLLTWLGDCTSGSAFSGLN